MSLLLDEEGNLRSFPEFRKAVKKVNIQWNDEWLRTEYNTAVRSARSAANYRDALRSKETYPNLEYLKSTSSEKREEHLEWVGTVLPIDHPWWDSHLPPVEWNCKCSFRPTDKPATDVPTSSGEEIPPVFRNNPGKTGEFVKLSEHPYLKGKGDPNCPECRRQGLVQGKIDNADEKSQLCPMHRMVREYTKEERKKLVKDAEKLAKVFRNTLPAKGGKRVLAPKLETGQMIIYRRSIDDMLGHTPNPTIKRLIPKIEEIVNKPTLECTGKADLNPDSHNLSA